MLHSYGKVCKDSVWNDVCNEWMDFKGHYSYSEKQLLHVSIVTNFWQEHEVREWSAFSLCP